MVQRAPLTEPPRPPVRGRPRPTRTQILVRRVLALGLVAVLLGALGTAGVVVLQRARPNAPPPPPPAPPPPPKLHIVFPEGFTRTDMAARISAVDQIAARRRHIRPLLSAQQYLALTARSQLPGRFAGDGKPRSLEGFLFPATYEFLPKTTTKRLVANQLAAFERNWGKLDLTYAKSKNLTPYDVLIIASMVEKETLAPEERRLVAAVIYNRLHAGMPLGIDATIRYALHIPGTESLHESQLANPTPYNTRLHSGLPPGPIANPGLASMQAAAHPAKVGYLYFVRKPDKVHHFFTSSYSAFQNYANAHGF